MNLNESSYERLNELQSGYMLNAWKPYLNAVNEVKGGKFRQENQLQLATLLENTKQALNTATNRFSLNENPSFSQAADIGPFKKYAFDIITAVMPNLIAQDIVSVQPLRQKIGQIFYLKYLYASNKGNTVAGSNMFSPYNVGNDTVNTGYSSEDITGEGLATTAGTATEYNAVLSWLPVRPNTVKVRLDGVVIAQDNGSGLLVSVGGSTVTTGSTVNYASGAITVKFSAAPAVGKDIEADYSYNLEYGPADVPEVNLKVEETIMTARPRKLKALYAFDAAYDLQVSQGINIDDALLEAVTSEIKHEIDAEIMNDLINMAGNPGGVSVFNKTRPSEISYREHKDAFVDELVNASSKIFQKSRRAYGNFIVVGKQAGDIIETLPGFVSSGVSTYAGPYFAGTLQGRWKVYRNPFYAETDYLVGYKGDLFMDAGYVYSPYLPIFSTQLLMLDDFVGRRGFATSYGKKMLNPDFYIKGTITTS